jgi:hypothetical protein
MPMIALYAATERWLLELCKAKDMTPDEYICEHLYADASALVPEPEPEED